MKSLFSLGLMTATASVSSLMIEDETFQIFCIKSLQKHSAGDWGDLEDEDKESNDFAVHNNERILSSYLLPDPIGTDEKIWIITEWDRSATTILFPSEY